LLYRESPASWKGGKKSTNDDQLKSKNAGLVVVCGSARWREEGSWKSPDEREGPSKINGP